MEDLAEPEEANVAPDLLTLAPMQTHGAELQPDPTEEAEDLATDDVAEGRITGYRVEDRGRPFDVTVPGIEVRVPLKDAIYRLSEYDLPLYDALISDLNLPPVFQRNCKAWMEFDTILVQYPAFSSTGRYFSFAIVP